MRCNNYLKAYAIQNNKKARGQNSAQGRHISEMCVCVDKVKAGGAQTVVKNKKEWYNRLKVINYHARYSCWSKLRQ